MGSEVTVMVVPYRGVLYSVVMVRELTDIQLAQSHMIDSGRTYSVVTDSEMMDSEVADR